MSFRDVPFIKLWHSNQKNRKGSSVALRSDLARELQAWVTDKASNDRVFDVSAGLLRIMDRDIEAVGIPKLDEEGRVIHIHALRHLFGTHLSLAGAAPRVSQNSMRHSDIGLMMGTYTDSSLLDTAAVVERLPSLPMTDNVSDTVAPNQVHPSPIESIPGNLGGLNESSSETKKPRQTLGLPGFHQVGDTEFESVTSTMSKRIFYQRKYPVFAGKTPLSGRFQL